MALFWNCFVYTVGASEKLHSKVFEELLQAGVSQECIVGLEPLFNECSPYGNPFSEVSNQHHQLAFLRKHFNIIVSLYKGFISEI